jgi:hypothetical protein
MRRIYFFGSTKAMKGGENYPTQSALILTHGEFTMSSALRDFLWEAA